MSPWFWCVTSFFFSANGRYLRRQKGQSFSWRVQNRTLKDSGENRTVRHVVLWICGKSVIWAGVSLSCGYVCTGVSFTCAYVLDPEPSQSLTTIHCHFHTPTSLHPCHFDLHSHFSSPIFGSGNAETRTIYRNGRGLRNTKCPCRKSKSVQLFFWAGSKENILR